MIQTRTCTFTLTGLNVIDLDLLELFAWIAGPNLHASMVIPFHVMEWIIFTLIEKLKRNDMQVVAV